jgi:signal transduction histidine kinase
MQEMRSLIFELRPAELETDGLVATLRKHVDVLTRVHDCEIHASLDAPHALSPEVERGLLRVAQEALANALKHSGARRVELGLDAYDSRVCLRVTDDGCGFDPVEAVARSRRLGLTSMRERVEALGGELRIDSAPGRGTTVIVEVGFGPADSRSAG